MDMEEKLSTYYIPISLKSGIQAGNFKSLVHLNTFDGVLHRFLVEK